MILCIYVDDVCCFGDEDAIEEAITEIEKVYVIKKLGDMVEYVGVTVDRKGDSLTLSQPDTITKLQEKFGDEIKFLKNYEAPAAQGSAVIRPKDDEEKLKEVKQQKYRSGVGMLLWLMKHSRPDVANAVREASKVMDGATEAHYAYLLQIIKFVVDTGNRKLLFKCDVNENQKWKMVAFSDSDFSGDKDNRRSISGFVIYLFGCPIAWRSRGQKSVTLSSTEAEYVALSEVTTEIIFILQVLKFLELDIEKPIRIYVDNIGAIYLAENSSSGIRTKHVDTRYHYVRELIPETVEVEFVKSEQNDSDPFTKNVKLETYQEHCMKWMIDCLEDKMVHVQNRKGVEKYSEQTEGQFESHGNRKARCEN